MHRHRATPLAALAVALTALAPAARGDTDVGGAVGALTGVFPPAAEKTEDVAFAAPAGGAPGGSLRAPEQAAGTATAMVAGAAATGGSMTGCLPYSVYAYVRIVDELGREVVYDRLRFQLQWCEDGFNRLGAGEGTCVAGSPLPYRGGVSRCWWSKGLWGGETFSFQTGATYQYRLGAGPVALPYDHLTLTFAWGASWYGPGTDVADDQCPDPEGMPEKWVLTCDAYPGSDW